MHSFYHHQTLNGLGLGGRVEVITGALKTTKHRPTIYRGGRGPRKTKIDVPSVVVADRYALTVQNFVLFFFF